MESTDENEVFLTTAQVAEILGCTRQYVARLRYTGVLSTYRRGATILLDAKEVRAFVTKRNTIVKVREADYHG